MHTVKTSFRALWKKKTFSVLNIAGLSVGIATSLLVFLVIRNETSYNQYNKNKDRIYRITGKHTLKSNGELQEYVSDVPSPLPDAIKQDFPQLEKTGSIWGLGQAQVYIAGKHTEDEKRFKETDGLVWTDAGLYEIFDYTWLAGNARELTEPNTVVLSKTHAEKYFGTANDAIGKTVQLWSFRIPFRVVGVFKDLPPNNDVPVNMGFSTATLRKLIGPDAFTAQEAWYGTGNIHMYVMLGKNQSARTFEAQLPSFVKRHYNEDRKDNTTLTQLLLLPLDKMHLDDRFTLLNSNRITIKELWALALIGIFLLVIACINFINLSTAQSLNRAKEIGVRKVLGSNRAQLVKQFLQETALVTGISLVLGILLAWISLPMLSGIMNKTLSLSLLRWDVLLFIVTTGITVTFLAGFYPAIVLSGFSPATIFKNKINAKVMGGLSLRRGLVVFQFIIAQLLVIGTIVVIKQMNYFRSRPMGFDKEGIALINLPSDSSLKVKYPTLIRQLSAVPGVTATSLCMEAPSGYWAWQSDVYFNNNPEKAPFQITRQLADTGYYRTFGIQLAAGRIPFHSDTTREIVLNETAVKQLGYHTPEEVLNKNISFGSEGIIYPVVGVVKDFNNKSLREAIAPMAISQYYNAYEWVAVRMNTSNISTVMPRVQKVFTALYPTYIYDQYFYDDRLQGYYNAEVITSKLFKLFAFLAIFISCLGLYGLVSFMAVQKTKEVGIRKVLGASVQHIVYLFSKEFTILIGIAFIIAAPTAYYFMNLWLSGFYYHTTMGWEVFVLAIVLSIIIAWITVGYRAVKAALVNPVKSLKSE